MDISCAICYRWEFMEWITTALTHNEIVLCERYTWSGEVCVYSSTLDPTLDLQGFMSVEKGIIAPDLVVYIDTPPSRVVGKHAISSLFDDGGFQQQLYDLYSQPNIWTGVQVMKHATQENKWNSSKALISALEKEPRIASTSKTWKYLWEDTGICAVCMAPYGVSDEVQGCYGCYAAVHDHCLMEDWRAERFPICCACGEVAPEPLPPLPAPDEDPPCEDDRPDIIPFGPESREPEFSEGFLEQLQESGSTPCDIHGMDHLSHDPTCEDCKRALGPMYRHLKNKYGPQTADHTPTLSFRDLFLQQSQVLAILWSSFGDFRRSG